jgi:hypothetical protein
MKREQSGTLSSTPFEQDKVGGTEVVMNDRLVGADDLGTPS